MDFSNYFAGNKEIFGGIKWDIKTSERMQKKLALERFGFKVYSQNDEDGIIEEIFNRIGVTNKVFFEFGVQDGLESNGHYLLHKGWNGFWIEGDSNYVAEIEQKFRPVIKNNQLKVKCAFITKDNINGLVNEMGMPKEIDLLSIDIDGNDYYVWENISDVNPRVVVIEYNAKFPPTVSWKMAYNAEHIWDTSDWQGASLLALEELGCKKGYSLVGTSITGVNAFFVRDDLIKKRLFLSPYSAEYMYNPMRSEIKHKSGHHARFCLVGQEEKLGILNYTYIQLLSGFHEKEFDGKRFFAWMKDSTATIKLLPRDGEYRIDYYLPEELIDDSSMEYTVCCNKLNVKKVGTIDKSLGQIIIDGDGVEPVDVEISISKKWRPIDILKSVDNRLLGLCVYVEEYS